MNNTEIIAEEIIKIAYDKGGLINADDLTEDQRKATTDNAVDYVMRFYGTFSGDGKNRYYGLNEKGFELGRRGFFSGEEKERKRQRTGVNIKHCICHYSYNCNSRRLFEVVQIDGYIILFSCFDIL